MDLIIKGLIAGGVTVCIILLSRFVGPKLAGALGGVPIVFAITYILLYSQIKDAQLVSQNEYLLGGVWGALGAIIFSFLCMYLNAHFPQYFWFNFIVSYGSCFLFAYIFSR